MVEFAVLAAVYIFIFLIIDYVLIKLVKPSKEVMKNALVAGIIMSITLFCLETYTYLAGIWGYKGNYFLFAVPITVPIYFVVVGFGLPIFYNHAEKWLKKKVSLPYIGYLLAMIIILVVSLISLCGDMLVANPEWAWAAEGWSYTYTYFIWVGGWSVNLIPFIALMRR
jgi:hypothetical protein